MNHEPDLSLLQADHCICVSFISGYCFYILILTSDLTFDLIWKFLYSAFAECTKKYWVIPKQKAVTSILSDHFSFKKQNNDKYDQILSLIMMSNQITAFICYCLHYCCCCYYLFTTFIIISQCTHDVPSI